MKKRSQQRHQTSTYTLLHELQSSATEPLPEGFRTHQLNRMWGGLANIETAETPTTDDWRVCSDAVNLMETLVAMGVVADENKLLDDAVTALANAGRRYIEHGAIRLDAQGMQAVRAVLEDYAEVIAVLPARTMVRCHRITERWVRDIQMGKRRPHDVVVMKI